MSSALPCGFCVSSAFVGIKCLFPMQMLDTISIAVVALKFKVHPMTSFLIEKGEMAN